MEGHGDFMKMEIDGVVLDGSKQLLTAINTTLQLRDQYEYSWSPLRPFHAYHTAYCILLTFTKNVDSIPNMQGVLTTTNLAPTEVAISTIRNLRTAYPKNSSMYKLHTYVIDKMKRFCEIREQQMKIEAKREREESLRHMYDKCRKK